MANVSSLRTPESTASARAGRALGGFSLRRFRRGRYLAAGLLLVVLAVVAVGAILISSAKASLTTDSQAIAKIGMPLGGGTVTQLTVVSEPKGAPIAVTDRGGKIYPVGLVPANEKLVVRAVIKRPGWISWLAGTSQRLTLTLITPVASLRSHFLTVAGSAPLRLHFREPITAFAIGPSGHLVRRVLTTPQSVISVPRAATAGTIYVSAAPRAWESARQAAVSYFPAGGAATAVALPAPGTVIKSSTPITLTFSRPVAKVLGSHMPPVSPTTAGTWHVIDSHAIRFVPEGYGYGLGAKVTIALPSGVRLIGGAASADATNGSWTVPAGSTLRLQQLLATLGYLPVNFDQTGPPTPLTESAQEAAAIKPPAGRFPWRYANTPSWLLGDWQAGTYGELTKGAVMAFENDHGFTDDGAAGALVWKALIAAVIAGDRSTFGYTVADVSEGTPETLTLWHSGKTVMSVLVNTGIPAAPTALGTFAVFEHLPVTTMTGLNPDGTPYSDPGIPWVSYFNGGDALHGFIRASYGFPQSLGCVEMPYATAGQVYPYTPIGTIVHVV